MGWKIEINNFMGCGIIGYKLKKKRKNISLLGGGNPWHRRVKVAFWVHMRGVAFMLAS